MSSIVEKFNVTLSVSVEVRGRGIGWHFHFQEATTCAISQGMFILVLKIPLREVLNFEQRSDSGNIHTCSLYHPTMAKQREILGYNVKLS